MSTYFGKAKNIELSFIKYIEDEIDDNWSGYDIRVVEAFNAGTDLDLPVICIQIVEPLTDRLEIGSNTLNVSYYLTIEVFANNHTERLAIVDFLLDRIMEGCVYYNHSQNETDNTILDLVESGRVTSLVIEENEKLEADDNVDTRDEHRQFISLIVKK